MRKAGYKKAAALLLVTSLVAGTALTGCGKKKLMKREQQLFKNYSMKLDQHMQIVMVDTLV